MAKTSTEIAKLSKAMEGLTRCTDCGRILTNGNFYVSSSRVNKHTKKVSLCKDCLTNLLVSYLEETDDVRLSIYYVCRTMGFVYLDNIYSSSMLEAGINKDFTIVQNGLEIWKKYIKTINSLTNYKGMSFENGEQIEINNKSEELCKTDISANKELTELELEQRITDKQNKKDIIKIVGYDPFENEKECDKPYFYARLVDMIDENMQQDRMKLTSVISIIKSQHQVAKLDDAISDIMSNPLQMVQRAGDIKVLSTTKKDIQKSALEVAKDNRISDLYSGTKTAGVNTLSGTVKKLKELDLTEAQVNLYDIQTSNGMRQVSYLSNSAIVDQLQFAENEYADMVAWQRGKVMEYEKMYKQLAEENRRLKVLCTTNDLDYKGIVFVEANYKEELSYNEGDVARIKSEEEEFNKIVKTVLPMDTMKYADKVIGDNMSNAKKKLLEEL